MQCTPNTHDPRCPHSWFSVCNAAGACQPDVARIVVIAAVAIAVLVAVLIVVGVSHNRVVADSPRWVQV